MYCWYLILRYGQFHASVWYKFGVLVDGFAGYVHGRFFRACGVDSVFYIEERGQLSFYALPLASHLFSHMKI